MMVVTAHSDAGSTESHLKFATLTYHGSKLILLVDIYENDTCKHIGDITQLFMQYSLIKPTFGE